MEQLFKKTNTFNCAQVQQQNAYRSSCPWQHFDSARSQVLQVITWLVSSWRRYQLLAICAETTQFTSHGIVLSYTFGHITWNFVVIHILLSYVPFDNTTAFMAQNNYDCPGKLIQSEAFRTMSPRIRDCRNMYEMWCRTCILKIYSVVEWDFPLNPKDVLALHGFWNHVCHLTSPHMHIQGSSLQINWRTPISSWKPGCLQTSTTYGVQYGPNL